jgi:hypothetical protein
MASRNLIETFTEDRASRLTGVSVRQLRYWDRDGFFSPNLGYEDRSVPYSRLYSFRDIVSLKVLNTLRNDAQRSVARSARSQGETPFAWGSTLGGYRSVRTQQARCFRQS